MRVFVCVRVCVCVCVCIRCAQGMFMGVHKVCVCVSVCVYGVRRACVWVCIRRACISLPDRMGNKTCNNRVVTLILQKEEDLPLSTFPLRVQ